MAPTQQLSTASPLSAEYAGSRDNKLWLQLWRDNLQDGFHQKQVNSLLIRFWSSLRRPLRGRVFVPLCGKSLDLIWLAEQGHDVVGVEISPLAVKAFFRDNQLKPVKKRIGDFTRWSHGRITILCGDFFALTERVLGSVDSIYDRAALTALPEDIRKLYVQQLQQLVPEHVPIFLLTVEDVEDGGESPVDSELQTLYSQTFNIRQVHVERVLEQTNASQVLAQQVTDYKVYKLQAR